MYPLLSTYCSGCHSTERTHAGAAQAPVHSDVDVNLAHEYALTRVNFREPENSRLVVRLSIERHNCFLGSCETAATTMLDAVTAWRDAVAGMLPEVPRGVDASTKIEEQQVLAWIEADKATIPNAERERRSSHRPITLSDSPPVWPGIQFEYASAVSIRPADVYNAIMALPGYSHELERELGVDKSKGMDSYDYVLTYEAITVDSRFLWRARQASGGYYWKTWDIFTQGSADIDNAYRSGDVTYPFWANPIRKFISNQGGTTPEDLSYVASRSENPETGIGRCDAR